MSDLIAEPVAVAERLRCGDVPVLVTGKSVQPPSPLSGHIGRRVSKHGSGSSLPQIAAVSGPRRSASSLGPRGPQVPPHETGLQMSVVASPRPRDPVARSGFDGAWIPHRNAIWATLGCSFDLLLTTDTARLSPVGYHQKSSSCL